MITVTMLALCLVRSSHGAISMSVNGKPTRVSHVEGSRVILGRRVKNWYLDIS